MSAQLDILALEPFYGGMRRLVLESLIRFSRHRWTVLKLPPRRIERRLTTAALWFSEQLTRHWVGKVDVIFTSDALNLADFYRLMPPLAKKPGVVYFHSNELPEASAEHDDRAVDLVNLNTAQAAQELWFNSLYHLRTFLERATSLVDRHAEIAGARPMPAIAAKARLMHPPIDLPHLPDGEAKPARGKRTVFVDTRDADVNLLNGAFGRVSRRGQNLQFITVGPVKNLAEELPRQTIPERDEVAQMRALKESALFLSVKTDCTLDYHLLRALHAGCRVLAPRCGVYLEMLPAEVHPVYLYEPHAEQLAYRLQDIWHAEVPEIEQDQYQRIMRQYDPMTAAKAFDERFEEMLAERGP